MLAVLSFGYSAIQEAMTTDSGTAGVASTAAILLTIALGKIVTTSLTIGSGGSGGVFGPSMVIGGCGGGALGVVFHHIWPWLVPHPASFVIVGMAGFFAAAAKTPFSTLIIVSEMTGGYSLLLPSLWVCAISFLLSDKQSIYSSQVESRSLSPAHQGSYVRQVLAEVRVGQFLADGQVPLVLRPQDPLNTVIDRLGGASHSVLPVVDDQQRLLGVVTLDEVYLASQASSLQSLVLANDLMRSDVQPLTPEDTLDRALELLVENDLLTVPVVADLAERRCWAWSAASTSPAPTCGTSTARRSNRRSSSFQRSAWARIGWPLRGTIKAVASQCDASTGPRSVAMRQCFWRRVSRIFPEVPTSSDYYTTYGLRDYSHKCYFWREQLPVR